jgi:hypothetical protein
MTQSVINRGSAPGDQTGETLYSAFGKVNTNFTELYELNLPYARTAYEIAAAVTPTHYGYLPGDVHRYGAVGDGTTDDTAAIRRAVSVINAGETFNLVFHRGLNYVVYTNQADDGSLCVFQNLNGVSVLGNGCTLTVNLSRTFTVSLGTLFYFDNCKNIVVDGFTTNGPTLDVSQTTVKGYEFVRCVNGCRDIYMPKNRVVNMIAGFIASKTGTDPDSMRTQNIRIGVLDVANCWYGASGQFSGDNFVIDVLRTNVIHRSIFFYGCSNLKFNIWSKDHKAADCHMNSAGMTGVTVSHMNNVEFNYHSDTDSTACGNAPNIALGCWGNQAQKMRNIRINLYVNYATSGNTGCSAFNLTKLDDSGAPDTNTGRGHLYENITIRGIVIGHPSDPSFGGCVGTDPNCDLTGDTISSLSLRDFTVNGDSAFSYCQFALPGLSDSFTLENVKSNYPINIVHANATALLPRVGKVVLNGVECLNRYVDDGTNYSLDNIIAGSATPTAYAGWMNGKTLTTRSAGGDMTWALPAATVGMEFRAVRTTGNRLSLDPNLTEIIRGGGAGKYFYTDTAGGSAHLRCFVAGTWEILSTYGTWNYEA